jgi:hypothetical protein
MNNLAEREVADKNVDEEAWLAARRLGVTATEVAKLASGSKAAELALLKEKRSGRRSFAPTRAMLWGLEREIAMVTDVLEPYGFAGTDMLYSAPDNPRHLATPDGLRVKDGVTSTAEVKTGKYDLTPGSEFFEKSGYRDQIQWQLYVLDASSALYVFERHDDVWIQVSDAFDREVPTPYPMERVWIERDQKRIGQLINVADNFLSLLDTPADEPESDVDDYQFWTDKWLECDAKEKRAAEAKKVAGDFIRGLIGAAESFAIETVGAKVSYSTSTRTTFDSAAFKTADPDTYKSFMRTSAPSSTLRITATKENN